MVEVFKPFGLSPIGPPPHSIKQSSVLFDERLGGWLGPWLMGATNQAVVGRTYGLLGGSWGNKFSYKEYMNYGNWYKSYGGMIGISAGGAWLSVSPFRWLSRKFVPVSGSGPTKEALDNAKFRLKIVADTDEEKPRSGSITISGDHDPAYLLTGM
jgi:hypothetical protein